MNERLKRLQERFTEVGGFLVIIVLTILLIAPNLMRELVEIIPFLFRLPLVAVLGFIVFRRYRHLWPNRSGRKSTSTETPETSTSSVVESTEDDDPMAMIRKRRERLEKGGAAPEPEVETNSVNDAEPVEVVEAPKPPSNTVLSDPDIQISDWMEDKGGDGDGEFWSMLEDSQKTDRNES